MLNLANTRNRHFLRTCRSLMAELPASQPINLHAIAARAAKRPAPHYYCTYPFALRNLRRLRAGRLTPQSRRYDMWLELYRKVTDHMERHSVNLPEALSNVLAAESASQYFISPSRAASLLSELMRGKI